MSGEAKSEKAEKDDYASKEPEPMPALTFDVDAKDIPSYKYPDQNHKEYLYDTSKMGDAEYAPVLAEGQAYQNLVNERRQAFVMSILPPSPETPPPVPSNILTPSNPKVVEVKASTVTTPSKQNDPSSAVSNYDLKDTQPGYYSNTMKFEYVPVNESEMLGRVERDSKVPPYVKPPNLKNQEKDQNQHRSSRTIKIVICIIIVIMFIMLMLCIAWLFKAYFIDFLGGRKYK